MRRFDPNEIKVLTVAVKRDVNGSVIEFLTLRPLNLITNGHPGHTAQSQH